jgi:hypothetical protein
MGSSYRRILLLALVAAVVASAGWAGVAAKPACAVDVTGTCGSLHFIFSGSDSVNSRTVNVSNTGSCDLSVFARKLGESQGETFIIKPGAAASRTGKFVHFTVLCTHGSNPCKATVTGFE